MNANKLKNNKKKFLPIFQKTLNIALSNCFQKNSTETGSKNRLSPIIYDHLMIILKQ